MRTAYEMLDRWLSPHQLPLTVAMVLSGVLATWARRRGGPRALWRVWLPAATVVWAAYARWAAGAAFAWRLEPWWWAAVAAAATALVVELLTRGRAPGLATGLVAAAMFFAATGYALALVVV